MYRQQQHQPRRNHDSFHPSSRGSDRPNYYQERRPPYQQHQQQQQRQQAPWQRPQFQRSDRSLPTRQQDKSVIATDSGKFEKGANRVSMWVSDPLGPALYAEEASAVIVPAKLRKRVMELLDVAPLLENDAKWQNYIRATRSKFDGISRAKLFEEFDIELSTVEFSVQEQMKQMQETMAMGMTQFTRALEALSVHSKEQKRVVVDDSSLAGTHDADNDDDDFDETNFHEFSDAPPAPSIKATKRTFSVVRTQSKQKASPKKRISKK